MHLNTRVSLCGRTQKWKNAEEQGTAVILLGIAVCGLFRCA